MTKIQWCDETINPIVGCSKISDGCANCYAEKMARRLKAMGLPQYRDVVDENGWTGRADYDFSVMEKPAKWRKPKRIFVCSMADLFHEDQPMGAIDRIMKGVMGNPKHTFIFLTKRPEKMLSTIGKRAEPRQIGLDWEYSLPLPNLWLGVTVESEKYLHRVETLLKIPAAVRFVSVEPMLGRFSKKAFADLYCSPDAGPDWWILGPETGPGRRPFNFDWARDLRDQCQAVGVPFFYKKHDDPATPADLRIAEFPEAQK